jgi:2-amino-4-hydroxy-6-hydroxymethyldihydropteridine diphosphokinase
VIAAMFNDGRSSAAVGVHAAYVGIGSNVGDRAYYLNEAVKRMADCSGIQVVQVSSIYETAPVGYTEQGPFLNMAVRLVAEVDPWSLLQRLLDIERELGRTRDLRWGPRTLDLDLLLYGDQAIQSEDLQLPHPRMWERGFVLVPLSELVEQEEPWFESIRQHLGKLEGKDGIKRWIIE